uniref:Uncharacterized protein n=1 Tax=Oryza sativa subsp. japonica TaxID=39947 RepID=Q6Z362_ORYSJ|nr:hypothetical protein [Oryza sativa Japonica Group]
MHPDGPKLHAIASESQAGQVPVRTDGMCLMTYNGGTTNPPDQATVDIQYNLTEHIGQTQEWQQTADAQFTNINNMIQQQHDDLQAEDHGEAAVGERAMREEMGRPAASAHGEEGGRVSRRGREADVDGYHYLGLYAGDEKWAADGDSLVRELGRGGFSKYQEGIG